MKTLTHVLTMVAATAIAVPAVSLASTSGARNPFNPEPSASDSAAQTNRFPMLRTPGGQVLRAPVLPVLPPGMKMAPVRDLRQGAQQLPEFVPPPPARPAASAIAAESPASVPETPTKNDDLYTRSAVDKLRAACKMSLKSEQTLRAPAEGGVLKIQFENGATKNCFVGVVSERAWASGRAVSATNVDLIIQPNPTRRSRTSRVSVASVNEGWSVQVVQAPGAEDLEEMELTK